MKKNRLLNIGIMKGKKKNFVFWLINLSYYKLVLILLGRWNFFILGWGNI